MKNVAGAVLYDWDGQPTDAPMALLTRRRVMAERIMVSQVRLDKGCDVPTHSHENEQICIVLSGKLRFGIGADGTGQRQECTVEPGQVLLLPSNVPHSAFAVEQTLVLDIFSPPSAGTGIDHVGKE
ncbi:MAG: cupin domain-containing protein [Tepidisphaeraceae bacterium]